MALATAILALHPLINRYKPGEMPYFHPKTACCPQPRNRAAAAIRYKLLCRLAPVSTSVVSAARIGFGFHPGEATMHRVMAVLILFAIATSIGGCACRSGYVGPAGGVHPPRCWIW